MSAVGIVPIPFILDNFLILNMSSLDIEGRGVRPDRVDFMTLPVALLYHEWTTE